MFFNWIKRTYNEIFVLASLKKKQRQFAWMLVVGCLVFAGYYLYKTKEFSQVTSSLLLVPGVIFLIGLLVPKLLKPVLLIWFFIGKLLGEITSILVLFVVYFFAFFPITFLRRVIKKQEIKSGWVKRGAHTIDYKKLY